MVPPPQRRPRAAADRTQQPAAAGPRADASAGDRVATAAPVGSLDAGGEAQAARTRLAAAQALGELAFTWNAGTVGHVTPAPPRVSLGGAMPPRASSPNRMWSVAAKSLPELSFGLLKQRSMASFAR